MDPSKDGSSMSASGYDAATGVLEDLRGMLQGALLRIKSETGNLKQMQAQDSVLYDADGQPSTSKLETANTFEQLRDQTKTLLRAYGENMRIMKNGLMRANDKADYLDARLRFTERCVENLSFENRKPARVFITRTMDEWFPPYVPSMPVWAPPVIYDAPQPPPLPPPIPVVYADIPSSVLMPTIVPRRPDVLTIRVPDDDNGVPRKINVVEKEDCLGRRRLEIATAERYAPVLKIPIATTSSSSNSRNFRLDQDLRVRIEPNRPGTGARLLFERAPSKPKKEMVLEIAPDFYKY